MNSQQTQNSVPWDFVKYCLIGLDCSLNILQSLVHCAPHLFVVTFYEKIRHEFCRIADFYNCDVENITVSRVLSRVPGFYFKKECRLACFQYDDNAVSVSLTESDDDRGKQRKLDVHLQRLTSASISNFSSRSYNIFEPNFASLPKISQRLFYHIECILTGEVKLNGISRFNQ